MTDREFTVGDLVAYEHEEGLFTIVGLEYHSNGYDFKLEVEDAYRFSKSKKIANKGDIVWGAAKGMIPGLKHKLTKL